MTARPACACDLRSFAWHMLRHDLDWIDRVYYLRGLAALDAAEVGDPDAVAQVRDWLEVTEVREDARGRRWLAPRRAL